MIKAITINVTGSQSRIFRILKICKKYRDYDVIGISEAGIDEQSQRYIIEHEELKDFTAHTQPAKEGSNRKESVMLLINKRWQTSRCDTGIERSVSARIHLKKNEFLTIHTVYGPHKEKEQYWKKWREALGDTTGQKVMVLGDFNLTMNYKVDRLNAREGQDKDIGRKLLNSTNLLDVWREDNMGKRVFTFHREVGAKEGEESGRKRKSAHSRIDLILLSEKLFRKHDSKLTKIEKQDYEDSGDHCGVTTAFTVETNLMIVNQSTPAEHRPDKLNLKRLKEREQDYIAEVGRNLEDYPESGTVDERLQKIIQVAYEAALKIGGRIEPRKIAQEREDKNISKLTKYLNRLTRGLNSKAEKGRLTKAIRKTELNPIEWKSGVRFEEDEELWREGTIDLKNKLQKKIYDQKKEKEQIKIRKAVEELQKGHITNLGKFVEKIKGKSKTIKVERARDLDGRRTGDAEEVKEITKEKMSRLFQLKTLPATQKPWLHTKKMKEIADKIRKTDKTDEEITEGEVLKLLTSLYKIKGRATSDDRPLELFTMAKTVIGGKLATIMSEILRSGRLPDCWKEGKIFMIYKPGKEATPEEIYDFRPITLLSATYKIYTHILNERIRKVHEPVFSPNQGGFREGKSCHHKLLTIRSIFEDAKEYNREIHALYIDIKKAYDNISAKEVAETMRAYGYNETIIRAIKGLGEGIFSRVITAYGLTGEINLQCGLRQGCPISPLLFIIFLDPLILQLNEEKLGYRMRNRLLAISNLAYADDMVLTTESNKEMQRALNIVNRFFNYYQLEISVKQKEKTVYTHNNKTESGLKLTYIDFNGKNIEIPFLEPNEPYPYLGVWIALDLNWDKQETMIRVVLYGYLRKLEKRALTTEQKILVVNLLVIPHIT